MEAILELIATLLSTLSGASKVLGPHVATILGAASLLVTQGEAAVPILTALTGHAVDMAATAQAQGAPTPAQVRTLNEHVASANALAASAPAIGS